MKPKMSIKWNQYTNEGLRFVIIPNLMFSFDYGAQYASGIILFLSCPSLGHCENDNVCF
jgi:hypothetical protein